MRETVFYRVINFSLPLNHQTLVWRWIRKVNVQEDYVHIVMVIPPRV